MLEIAKRLITPSARSNVPPFMVMDVMAAAARIEAAPGRVIVTTGSSAGFILAFLALFEPGARVAVATPGYPPYRHILSALGCEPVLIDTTADTRWEITREMLLS